MCMGSDRKWLRSGITLLLCLWGSNMLAAPSMHCCIHYSSSFVVHCTLFALHPLHPLPSQTGSISHAHGGAHPQNISLWLWIRTHVPSPPPSSCLCFAHAVSILELAFLHGTHRHAWHACMQALHPSPNPHYPLPPPSPFLP